MDSEMVAASLDVAHKDVVSALPQDARIPVGWRFMDKFVQLPFVIPPIDDDGFRTLSTSLLKRREDQDRIDAAAATVAAAAAVGVTTSVPDDFTEDDVQTVIVEARRIEESRAQREAVAAFDETNEEVRAVIERGMRYFGGNPREIKRFVNAFRLYVFLWADKARSSTSSLTLTSIMRWTAFMLKWPDVMRWTRRGRRVQEATSGGSDAARRNALIDRVSILEDSARAETLEAWSQQLREGGVPEGTRWLDDQELYRFFREIADDENEPRLSAGVGHGLW
jgi:hypothetical protein